MQPRILALVLLCCLARAALVRHPPAHASTRAALGGPAARAPPVALTAPAASPFEEGSAGTDTVDTVGQTLELTMENVDTVLEEMRPYLLADGGNVAVRGIEGGVVELELQGACGSCPSSSMTMKMGLERGLREKIPEIVDVVQVAPEGPVLDEAGVEEVLEQIRPFLAMAGGEVELVELVTAGAMPTAKLRISGSGSTINSVRVEIAQRLKRNFPTLGNVMWE